jgi:uncharacterized membrane protein
MGRVSTLLILVSSIVVVPLALVVGIVFRFSQIGTVLSITVSILSFAGYIMFLVAMHRFAAYYKEPAIFSNVLYSFLISVVGGIVFAIVLLLSVFSFATTITTVATGASVSSFVYSFLFLLAVMVLGALVLALIQGVFYRRAFNVLAEKSGQDNFQTAGLLMLIGGALTIVLVGSIVFLVGWIFAAKGFFSMHAPAPQAYSPSQQIPAAGTVQQRYCPNCGAANPVDAFFCSYCGKKL